jgi:hypothetical protein
MYFWENFLEDRRKDGGISLANNTQKIKVVQA